MKMAVKNIDLLTKCLELTKHMVNMDMMFYINVKMGDGDDKFEFNVNNNFPKKKPSQLKRDFERKQEFIKTKVKLESNKDGDDIEEKLKHKEVTGKKKSKKLRCKIASHMGSAAESVLKSAVAKCFSYNMSRNINWNKSESKWDIPDKVDGIFGGIHEFEIPIEDETEIDAKLEQMKQNWSKGQFPTKLMNIWVEDS